MQVEVSRQTEQHILEAIKSRENDAVLQRANLKQVGKVCIRVESRTCPCVPPPRICSVPRAGGSSRNAPMLEQVWDELLELGFSEESTSSAIRSTPTIAVPDCLDWLCLNLQEVARPLFAGGGCRAPCSDPALACRPAYWHLMCYRYRPLAQSTRRVG